MLRVERHACSASMTSGKAKASVLPEPVNATPIMSRPDSSTGSPCRQDRKTLFGGSFDDGCAHPCSSMQRLVSKVQTGDYGG